MATNLAAAAAAARPIAVTPSDRILAGGALLLLGATLTAIVRGFAEWAEIPTNVWLHLSTILVATALTPVMLLRRRGDRLHRRIGYVWIAAMFLTAAISFDIRGINDGGLSPIHVLSALTMIQAPLIAWRARQHDVVRHRRAVTIMVTGALLIAGIFTFPFNRLMGQWLFG
jgi:uncharacterized membrane protein